VCLLFGYFFFWTVRDDFPPEPATGPGILWPALSAGFVVAACVLLQWSRGCNRAGRVRRLYVALASAALLSVAGAAALVAGPWTSGLDPTSHSYPAIVWLLVLWGALHVVVGLVMLAYCFAGRIAGRLTPEFDADLHNTVLFWQFATLTVVSTALVIAGFPLVA
jgi:cytochrome c oxidase subunit I+III